MAGINMAELPKNRQNQPAIIKQTKVNHSTAVDL